MDPKVTLTAQIAAAYLEGNRLSVESLPGLVQTIHSALASTLNPPAPEAEKPVPAVPIKKSVTPDYIVCLEDGKKLTMLKRYLRTAYGMMPDEYRAKWGLPHDYPMVAPNYSKRRSTFARDIGLGRRRTEAPVPELEQAAPPEVPAPEVEQAAPPEAPKKTRSRRKAA